ncbi:MAG: glycoside hydrolase family 95 protein, partial [Bacteroidota bacterium]|nr:glycoside hydrolase family 95 protein [Bacteroidota bacterium]
MMQIRKLSFLLCLMLGAAAAVSAQQADVAASIQNRSFDPATLLWYGRPAKIWNDALPIGNGRLGAMIFGDPENERIQLNEDTYWSGGPYSSMVKGGANDLPELRQFVFKG